MVFDSIFERYFGIQLNNMKKGIEVTLSKETAHPCALLLSAYTEGWVGQYHECEM